MVGHTSFTDQFIQVPKEAANLIEQINNFRDNVVNQILHSCINDTSVEDKIRLLANSEIKAFILASSIQELKMQYELENKDLAIITRSSMEEG